MWKYQIVKYEDGDYALHTVYYNRSGEPWARNETPTYFHSDNLEDLQLKLTSALHEAKELPVIEEPFDWSDPDENLTDADIDRILDTGTEEEIIELLNRVDDDEN